MSSSSKTYEADLAAVLATLPARPSENADTHLKARKEIRESETALLLSSLVSLISLSASIRAEFLSLSSSTSPKHRGSTTTSMLKRSPSPPKAASIAGSIESYILPWMERILVRFCSDYLSHDDISGMLEKIKPPSPSKVPTTARRLAKMVKSGHSWKRRDSKKMRKRDPFLLPDIVICPVCDRLWEREYASTPPDKNSGRKKEAKNKRE